MRKRHPICKYLLIICLVALPLLASRIFISFAEPETIIQGAIDSAVDVYTEKGAGAGFVYSGDGYVITADHVVHESHEVDVVLYDGNIYPAKLIAENESLDTALLKISPKEKLKPASIGNSDSMRIGERVFAIGNPFDMFHSVSGGIVSNLHRDLDLAEIGQNDFIQTTAAINPGNSGGALFDRHGSVVGIVDMVMDKAQNIGYVIPINTVIKSFAPTQNHVKIGGKLGIVMNDLTIQFWFVHRNLMNLNGVYIQEIIAGSPSDRAGLKSGDIVERVDNVNLGREQAGRLGIIIATTPIGDILHLTVLRDGKLVKFSVKPEIMPVIDTTKKGP